MAKSVLILMGSKSDLMTMSSCCRHARKLAEYELTVASAHRSPERVDRLVRGARDRGVGVVSPARPAHLAVCAGATTLPSSACPGGA